MTRGGKRPGAGRKATRPPAKRRLMLELDASEARDLAYLRLLLGWSRGTPPLDSAATIRCALLHLLAGVRPCPMVRHRDGNPDNVELSNLELV